MSDGYYEYPGCSRYQYASELHSSPAYMTTRARDVV